MCCLHFSFCQFSGGSYLGFFVVVVVVVVFKRKETWFGSGGVTRDKLVFGMNKHGHLSFQILTRDFYSLDFGTKPLITHPWLFFLFYFLNFGLGHPFGFSTYWVRTSYLPLGSLEAYAWCLHCPSVGFRGICCCRLSWPCSKKKQKKLCRFLKKNFQGQEIFKGFSIDRLS